jgi:glycine dehydrogenase subunit 1
MPFIPHTQDDIAAMLEAIGVDSVEALFDEIPAALKSDGLSKVPPGMNEMEVTRLMYERAELDRRCLNFIGAGAYEHHIPAAIWEIATRGEFYSSYTPYQAEVSQGTLQVVYEHQSMIGALTAMAVANAGLYDGASALAEAVLMAVRLQQKSRKVLLPVTLHPIYRRVVRTIVKNQHIELLELPYSRESGLTVLDALAAERDFAALAVPQPNFFGLLEEVDELTDLAHERGAIVIAVTNPTSLAILKPPGEWGNNGADIAVGEGQPLGIPLSSGGPYFGFMACRQELIRQMPGRIVGRTVDRDGKSAYTLTLQAREQHIRRSKATSNICTNQGLMVTAATIYLALLGPDGLARVAAQCHANLLSLVNQLEAIAGVRRLFPGAVFHEAALSLPAKAADVLRLLAAEGILGGLDLSTYYPELNNALLVCATETKTPADLQRYAARLSAVLGQIDNS